MSQHSYSQNGQDLWVKRVFANQRDGFFLEIGGGDGIWISNTLLLEETLGWTGILVEPTNAYQKLVVNRPNCICVNRCVSSDYRQITLFEIHDKGQAAISANANENSLLTRVSTELSVDEKDKMNSRYGEVKDAYIVDAVPLASLLEECQSPSHIDYFSLDVEGHEDEILRVFPFDKYTFGCLGVERPSVFVTQLLQQHGYQYVRGIGGDSMFLNQRLFDISQYKVAS